jgi:hypothetical protein
MFAIATPGLAVGLLSAGATVYGANQQGKAAKSAAESQAQGTQAGIAENARQYDQTRADNMPYLLEGRAALAKYAAENDVPLDLTKIQMDPGYEFGRAQGQQAIDRKAAAAGGRISGAALKEAAQFGTDYATTGYSTAYGRVNQVRADRLNRLAALANIGQTSTQQVGALGAQTARANSDLMVQQGNNAGAAQLAQGNIWGNTTNQLAAIAGKYYSAPTRVGSTANGAWEGWG